MKRSRIVIAISAAAALAVLAIACLAFADRILYYSFQKRATQVKVAAGKQDDVIVTETDLSGLPEPLVRYLRFSGVVGKKKISSIRLVHFGEFKPGADMSWAPIRGEYSLTTKKPSFTWYGKISIAPGLSVIAIDSYFAGKGRMQVKALSIFPIVDARSQETAQSAFGRCAAELLSMAPSFALERDFLRCAQTGPDQVRCKVTDGGLSADADLFVNADGSLDRVVVMRYFDRGNGKSTLERFTGKGSSVRSFAGLRLASRFDGYWNLTEGDLHYVAFTVDSVQVGY
jgi:hypothetical protein